MSARSRRRDGVAPPAERLTLTPEEVAQLVGVRTQRVYDACYAGQLRYFALGRALHIPREAVDAWVRALCAETEVRMGRAPAQVRRVK